jgi:hypothetical protein
MKPILLILTFSVLINVQNNAQRDSQSNRRGQESGNIERINRNHDENRRNNTNQRTIIRNQTITQEPLPVQPMECVYIKPTLQGDCIVITPDKYSFPDRIYAIPYIEPVLQYFFLGDFDGAIEMLNYLIEENPFVPELHFLRGVAYINRESDFKKPDYWQSQYDFITVKTLDPAFPGLKHYLDLLDLYLWGKRPEYIGTR